MRLFWNLILSSKLPVSPASLNLGSSFHYVHGEENGLHVVLAESSSYCICSARVDPLGPTRLVFRVEIERYPVRFSKLCK